jgi:hypothetical protein
MESLTATLTALVLATAGCFAAAAASATGVTATPPPAVTPKVPRATGKPASAAERLKYCTQQAAARKLSGAPRQTFMSGCLKSA